MKLGDFRRAQSRMNVEHAPGVGKPNWGVSLARCITEETLLYSGLLPLSRSSCRRT